ncbi:MAG TPA: conjugative transposon protein TraM [Puia sp.]|jgi:hypothetical protein|nr:conjugative transposon protein TraM [Puia sp.]
MLQHAKRRFLLAAPLIVLPFICGIFYALGGGHGNPNAKDIRPHGLNRELPLAFPDPRKTFLDKMNAYLKADRDSVRRQEYAQQDPYRRRDTGRQLLKADELLLRLNRLKQSLQQPRLQPPHVQQQPLQQPPPAVSLLPRISVPPRQRWVDTPDKDPQLERLNSMLDKVIRIQHPEEGRPTSGQLTTDATETVTLADSSSNAIAAVIPADQTLTSGGTLPIRLSEDIRVHGIRIAAGGWLYGTATITGDRLQVYIRSIRDGRNLYQTDLQVYDLDGLPGIHIPDILSQDAVKQSSSDAINGLNLLNAEASLGAQAASAGIQATKSLLARKARLVRVSVRAGYQVLLRNPNGGLPRSIKSLPNLRSYDSVLDLKQPPGFVPGGSFLQRRRSEGVELTLQSICLKDSLLWFALQWRNHSAIDFTPQYYRWVLRDRRSFRRTAQQELPLDPVCSPRQTTIAGDSTLQQWAGFRPFTPGKDKQLVLEVGDRNGGRVITLLIHFKQILNAKRITNEKAETGATTSSQAQSLLHVRGVRHDQGAMEEVRLSEFQ